MITVITPCGSSLASGTYRDCLALQAAMGSELILGPVMGAMHADQLILGARTALSNGSSHLGIIEHDMRFPADAFQRLRAHDKPIIGANYRQRQKTQWTTLKDHASQLVSRDRSGVEIARSVGMGVMLISVDVFRIVPEPWWSTPWIFDEGRHCGIDVFFGLKASKYGCVSWVDHDLSQQVAHIAGDIELWPDRLVYTQTGHTLCELPEGA